MDDLKTTIKAELKVKKPSMYTCVFINDDYTPMDFVVHVLMVVFNLNIDDAVQYMLKIHREGKANVGSYTYEVASHKADLVVMTAQRNEVPLQVLIEPI